MYGSSAVDPRTHGKDQNLLGRDPRYGITDVFKPWFIGQQNAIVWIKRSGPTRPWRSAHATG